MKYIVTFLSALMCVLTAMAQVEADSTATKSEFATYWATLYAGGATGEFAPSLIGGLNHGKTPYRSTALIDAGIKRSLDLSSRFSWGFGLEGLAGVQGSNNYDYYDEAAKAWTQRREHAPYVWLQQLYGEVKYRGVFLTVGMKEYEAPLVNQRLSSGDLVFSGNTRPIPQVRVGFVDFQNIPFTNGWVQIQGELAFGKMMDNAYMKSHYNYYNYHINLWPFYNYKRCFFRTKPSQPLSVTVGMQAGGFFGGETYTYNKGELVKERKYSKSFKTFMKMFLPMGSNGEDFYVGQHLGSWDLQARYRLRSSDEIKAYFQWLWEDGSGIGKMNGWDGLWGIEYRRQGKHWLNGAVVEYLDFRNQSGPMHWAPTDYPGTTITTQATGNDNYYNNSHYNAWANYGMALGSPFFVAPIYNLDGYPAFLHNRTNGFHIGADGNITPEIDWRLLLSYSRSLGRYMDPLYHALSSTSMMVEAGWDAASLVKGLEVRGQVGFDAGSLRPRTFGGMLTVSYRGSLHF